MNADRGERPLTVLVKIAAEVDAPPTAIWDVLKACEIAPEYVPNVVSCKKLEELDDGRADLFVQIDQADLFHADASSTCSGSTTCRTRGSTCTASAGRSRTWKAAWWLLPQENGRILLVYELALDPGMPIPRFLVRATLKRDLPKVMQAVRERAEAAPIATRPLRRDAAQGSVRDRRARVPGGCVGAVPGADAPGRRPSGTRRSCAGRRRRASARHCCDSGHRYAVA